MFNTILLKLLYIACDVIYFLTKFINLEMDIKTYIGLAFALVSSTMSAAAFVEDSERRRIVGFFTVALMLFIVIIKFLPSTGNYKHFYNIDMKPTDDLIESWEVFLTLKRSCSKLNKAISKVCLDQNGLAYNFIVSQSGFCHSTLVSENFFELLKSSDTVSKPSIVAVTNILKIQFRKFRIMSKEIDDDCIKYTVKIDKNFLGQGDCFNKLNFSFSDILSDFYINIDGFKTYSNHVSRNEFIGSKRVPGWYMCHHRYMCYSKKDIKEIRPSKNNEPKIINCTWSERMNIMTNWIKSRPESKNRERLYKYLENCINWYHGRKITNHKTTLEYRIRWENHMKWVLGSECLVERNVTFYEKKTNQVTKHIPVIVDSTKVYKQELKVNKIEVKTNKLVKTGAWYDKEGWLTLKSELVNNKVTPIVYDEGERIEYPKQYILPEGSRKSTIENGTVKVKFSSIEKEISDEWIEVTKSSKLEKTKNIIRADLMDDNYYAVLKNSSRLPMNEYLPVMLSPCLEDVKDFKDKKPKKYSRKKLRNKADYYSEEKNSLKKDFTPKYKDICRKSNSKQSKKEVTFEEGMRCVINSYLKKPYSDFDLKMLDPNSRNYKKKLEEGKIRAPYKINKILAKKFLILINENNVRKVYADDIVVNDSNLS